MTEFKYPANVGDVFRGNNGQRLAYLENFGEGWDFMAGLSAIVFIDNHDNQRGHGAGGSQIITFRDDVLYKMVNAYELAWAYGYVRIMSSYIWPRDIQVYILFQLLFFQCKQGFASEKHDRCLSEKPTLILFL